MNSNPKKNSENKQLEFQWPAEDTEVKIYCDFTRKDSYIEGTETPIIFHKEWQDLESDAQN